MGKPGHGSVDKTSEDRAFVRGILNSKNPYPQERASVDLQLSRYTDDNWKHLKD